VRGFRVTDFMREYLTRFHVEVLALILEGKIKPLEQQYFGLNNGEQALVDINTGANFGKAVVIMSDDL
jgi:NADPH-dependent curcumin reductase CurA